MKPRAERSDPAPMDLQFERDFFSPSLEWYSDKYPASV